MPSFTSRDAVRSGMPLGGIGAGKLEIRPNGVFDAFTFLNNWSHPIAGDGISGLLGYHLAVSAEPAERTSGARRPKKAFLLQTAPVAGLPTVRAIRYEGSFPRVVLSYDEPSLDVAVTLEAFSPWIPGDVKNSSLPVVFFSLKIRNRRRTPVRAGFLFIGRNVSGDWTVGRRNRVIDETRSVHLEFSHEDRAARDPKNGVLRFSFEKPGWRTSYFES